MFGFAAANSGVPQSWAAGSATPGVNLVRDLTTECAAQLAEAARRLRRADDLLIASIHWGGNWGYTIDEHHRAFAHTLIDGGFDLVHGHSSHHPKGLDVYRRKLILYGCGDFINDYEGIAGFEEFRGDLSLMYLPRLASETGTLCSLRMVPMQMRRFRLQRPSATDISWLFEVLDRESRRLGNALIRRDDGSLEICNAGG